MAEGDQFCASHVKDPADSREISRVNIKLVHVGSKNEKDADGNEGTKTYTLDLSEYGQEVMLGHLIDAAERVTGVPFSHMKLIHKGRSLTGLCPKKVLKHEGIKNGAKVLMIGRKPIPSDVVQCKRLMELEASIDPVMERMHDVDYELTGIEKGHLNVPQQVESIKRIKQLVAASMEWFMRTIETADGLQLDKESNGARVKRKLLISRIQDNLSFCDKMMARVEKIKSELDKLPQ